MMQAAIRQSQGNVTTIRVAYRSDSIEGLKIEGLKNSFKIGFPNTRRAGDRCGPGQQPYARLIPITEKQVRAAQDALRVTRENFQAGTGLFLDVLHWEIAWLVPLRSLRSNERRSEV
jgi:hypothetical protein